MFNRIEPFTPRQQAFLEDNFEIYDPDTGNTYKEFSSLKSATVIFLGELHHTHIINTIQSQFFDLFLNSLEVEGSSACVLLEGLIRGEILSPIEISRCEKLPNAVSIRGSDVRSKMTKYESFKFMRIMDAAIKLRQENKQVVCHHIRKIAELINISHAENQLKFKGNGIVEIPHSFDIKPFRSLDECYLKYKNELSVLNGLVRVINKGHESSYKLIESNNGLFEEINNASKVFYKIIPIWGIYHFAYGSSLFKRLKEAKISYTVLFPCKNIRSLAKEEQDWRLSKRPTVQLNLEGNLGKVEIDIPMCFKHYFHPDIPMSSKSEQLPIPIVLNLEKLLSCKDSDLRILVSANTGVHLEKVDFRRPLGVNDSTEKTILLSFHDLALFSNYAFLGFELKGEIFIKPVEDDLNLIVSIRSTKPFVIKFGLKGTVFTNLDTMIFLMKRHGLFEYEFKFGRDLFLYDLEDKDIQEIMSAPTKLYQLIQLRSNGELEVAVRGGLRLEVASCILGHNKLLGLKISLEEGSLLIFTRK